MKISVITVTLNNISLISDCLESVRKQKFNNIEHIVIDGGSTDGTINLLKSKYSKLITLVSEPDNGIYDAMNKGIKIAKGDVVGFLNSDDFYKDNEVLKKVARIFKEDTSIQACYADLIYVERNNKSKILRYFKSRKFVKGLFPKGWCPPHPTFFVRSSIFKKYGNFDLNYRIASDVDLMMRYLEKYKVKAHYTPEVWVIMRNGGISNKSLKNILLQNKEILSSFNKNNLSVNLLKFFIIKIFSRIYQFLKRPPK